LCPSLKIARAFVCTAAPAAGHLDEALTDFYASARYATLISRARTAIEQRLLLSSLNPLNAQRRTGIVKRPNLAQSQVLLCQLADRLQARRLIQRDLHESDIQTVRANRRNQATCGRPEARHTHGATVTRDHPRGRLPHHEP
jgi:hypothetical protein